MGNELKPITKNITGGTKPGRPKTTPTNNPAMKPMSKTPKIQEAQKLTLATPELPKTNRNLKPITGLSVPQGTENKTFPDMKIGGKNVPSDYRERMAVMKGLGLMDTEPNFAKKKVQDTKMPTPTPVSRNVKLTKTVKNPAKPGKPSTALPFTKGNTKAVLPNENNLETMPNVYEKYGFGAELTTPFYTKKGERDFNTQQKIEQRQKEMEQKKLETQKIREQKQADLLKAREQKKKENLEKKEQQKKLNQTILDNKKAFKKKEQLDKKNQKIQDFNEKYVSNRVKNMLKMLTLGFLNKIK